MLVTAFRDQENRYDHVFFLKKQNFLSPHQAAYVGPN